MEFMLGGMAACGACLFTNPLEVAKTRMQLQGELAERGRYTLYYRNVVHAFYTIYKVDGLKSLQKGLVPALWYQFVMSGVRLGIYQCFLNSGKIHDFDGKITAWKSILAGATAGCCGAFCGSPMYMLKIQLQSKASVKIAVGYQHDHSQMSKAFRTIYQKEGILGLWRGVSAAVFRHMVGSASQLTIFTWSKEYLTAEQMLMKSDALTALAAGVLSGSLSVVFMIPFDVMSTRLYNQGTDKNGRGVLYKNLADCFIKTFHKEGLWGFYKGWGASLFRIGPHTCLTLFFLEST